MDQQIIEQGKQALAQMQLEFKRSAFWNNSSTGEWAITFEGQEFAPETAATADCNKNHYPAEEKKTSGSLLVNPGQPG
jgi:hypothetical protein